MEGRLRPAAPDRQGRDVALQLPEDILDELRRVGRRFDSETIQAAYDLLAPLHEGREAPRVVRDLAYGPDPRHRLDGGFGDVLAGFVGRL